MQINLSPRELQGQPVSMQKCVELMAETFELRKQTLDVHKTVIEQNLRLATQLTQDNLLRLKNMKSTGQKTIQAAERDAKRLASKVRDVVSHLS